MTSIKISSVWEEAGSVSSQEEGRTWARPAAWINDESVAFYVARLSQSSAPKWAFFFFHSLGQQRLNFLNDFAANIADPSFAPLIDVFRLKLCWVLGSFWQWQSKWFITTHSTDTASLCFGFFPSLLIVELRKKKKENHLTVRLGTLKWFQIFSAAPRLCGNGWISAAFFTAGINTPYHCWHFIGIMPTNI